MSKLKELIFRSDFTKNVTVMLSGNGLAMIFPFIMAPFISRIYSPDDFAGFELFVKIAALIAVISALRFEVAILLPKANSEADSLFKLSIKLLLIVTALTVVLVLPFREEIGELLDNRDLADLLWLLPPAVFFMGGGQILSQYIIRLKKFKELASNKVLGAISNHGSKYILGLSSPIGLSLVWGQLLGHAIPTIAYLRLKKIRNILGNLFNQEVKSKLLFKKYRDFPLVNSAHAFFDEGQKALLLFLISAYYGELILGLFAFSWRYLRVPLQVFGNSLSQVLNEKWARDLEKGIIIRSALIRTSLGLLAIAVVPFGLLFFFGEPIFKFVFGNDWSMAGKYAEYMAPWLLLHFVVSPISFLPVLFERQKTNFAIVIVGNLTTLLLVVVMSLNGFSFEDVLIAIVASHSVLLVVTLFWIVYISRKSRANIGVL